MCILIIAQEKPQKKKISILKSESLVSLMVIYLSCLNFFATNLQSQILGVEVGVYRVTRSWPSFFLDSPGNEFLLGCLILPSPAPLLWEWANPCCSSL